MKEVGLSWFAADRVFEGRGGWYIGAPDGFSIGPYDSRAEARRQADALRHHMAGARDVSEKLQLIRQVLEERPREGAWERRFGRVSPARSGEPPRLDHRSPRLFSMYGKWYFATREGIDVGPYASKQAAERDQQRLVAMLRDRGDDRARRLAVIEFMAAGR